MKILYSLVYIALLTLLGIVATTSISVLHTRTLFVNNQSTARTINGCQNIPASPDYLMTNRASDAIAALNNARRIEHLPSVQLPANFYQLDPAQQQFLLLNQERTLRNLVPLQLDANLSQMAQGYSQQLHDLHFFSHTSPIAGSFSTRLNSNPLIVNHYSLAAENLAGNPVAGIGPIYEYMYNDVAEACGHRQNILNPQMERVGIGLVADDYYGSISAQEFLVSAPWNPYSNTILPNTYPHLSLVTVTHQRNLGLLMLQAHVDKAIGSVRVSWFLDNESIPLHTGASLSLDLRHFMSSGHSIRVYAVDGEQHYAVEEYNVPSYVS